MSSEVKSLELPETLLADRKLGINLAIAEFYFCLASLALYAERSHHVLLILTAFSFIANGLGFWSKLTLSRRVLMTHACFTISLVVGLYLYILVYYLATLKSDIEQHGMSEPFILFLGTIPFLFQFLLGLHSICLYLKVESEILFQKAHKVAESSLMS